MLVTGGPFPLMSSNRPAHELSSRGVPQSWLEAEKDSPSGDSGALFGGEFSALVERRQSHAGTLFLGGLLAMVIVGPLWYLGEATGLADIPWIAAVAGCLVGLIVRLTCSAADSGPRLMLALNSFVIVAVAVSVVAAFVDVGEIYGAATTMANYEFYLQARFRNLHRLAAHAIGMVAAAYLGRSG